MTANIIPDFKKLGKATQVSSWVVIVTVCLFALPVHAEKSSNTIQGVVRLDVNDEPEQAILLDIPEASKTLSDGESKKLELQDHFSRELNLNTPQTRRGTSTHIKTLALGGVWPQNPNAQFEAMWDDGINALAFDDASVARQYFTTLTQSLNSPLTAYHYGSRLASLGYLSLAETAFNQARIEDPTLTNAIEAQQAIYFTPEALSLKAEDTWVLALLHSNALPVTVESIDTGRPLEAITNLRRLIQQNPRFTPAYYALGMAFAQQQQWPQAREAFEYLTEVSPDNPMGYKGLGHVAMIKQDYGQAKEQFKRAYNRAKHYPSAATAQLVKELKGQQQAASSLQKSSTLSVVPQKRRKASSVAHAWLNDAQGKLIQEDYPGTQAAAQNALTINPNLSTAKLILTEAALAQSDWEAINAHDKIILSQARRSAWAALLNGETEARRQNLTKAKQSYQRAIRLAPHQSGAYMELSRFLVKQGKIEKAISVLSQGEQQVQADWEQVELMMARAHLLKDSNPELSLQLTQNVLTQQPGSVDAYLMQHYLYKNWQAPQQAQNALMSAWVISDQTQEGQTKVLTALGDWTLHGSRQASDANQPVTNKRALQAVAFYEQALQVDPTDSPALKALSATAEQYHLELNVPKPPVQFTQAEQDATKQIAVLVKSLANALQAQQQMSKVEGKNNVEHLNQLRKRFHLVKRHLELTSKTLVALETMKILKRVEPIRRLGLGYTNAMAKMNHRINQSWWQHRGITDANSPELEAHLKEIEAWGSAFDEACGGYGLTIVSTNSRQRVSATQ